MEDGPTPIGPDIERVLDNVLSEHIVRERVRLLREHADAVLDVWDRHRRVWREMLGREVRVMVFDGLSPKAAEQAAKTNLGVRKQELDAELEAELGRLRGELARKMRLLLEAIEDERAVKEEGEAPPA